MAGASGTSGSEPPADALGGKRPLRVLLVAEESAGVQALRLLTTRGEDVVAVLTSAGDARGSSVATVAERLGVPRREPAPMREPAFARWIEAERIDVLLNVHSLHVAAPEVLSAPRIGAFNLHPGPLPRYAGLDAPSWAICEGQTRHAVTLHWMVADVDAGDVAFEAAFDIAPDDTGLSVAANCVRHGIPLIEQLLDRAAAGGADALPRRVQDPSQRRWYGRRPPYGGRLPWALSAREVVDLVRAADYAPFRSPWGYPVTRLDGAEIEVARVTATGEPTSRPPGTIGTPRAGGVPVAAADEWVLVGRVRRDGAAVAPEVALPGGRLAPESDDRANFGRVA